ncbi:MAG: hypothetical protein HY903_05365 [Deltaproteobacteria bacterium]|nr:hypothetical protein [Deltaproteobacteria bacterium]
MVANLSGAAVGLWDSSAMTSWPRATPVITYRSEVLCDRVRLTRSHTRSQTCIVCHDGSVTTASRVAIPSARSGGAHHPVGVVYDPAGSAGDRSALRPLATLPAAIVLPEGRVECVSCHDAFDDFPKSTAMTMVGSALCLACHDK